MDRITVEISYSDMVIEMQKNILQFGYICVLISALEGVSTGLEM